MSTGVIGGPIWIGFAAYRPTTPAVMAVLVERSPPGEEFTGYS